jgi:hypothetical protein
MILDFCSNFIYDLILINGGPTALRYNNVEYIDYMYLIQLYGMIGI